MKKTLQYILFMMIPGLIILNNNTFSQPDFSWQHPLPTGNEMKRIRFYDALTGIAAGDHGTIMKTSNGGVNWFVQNSNTTANLYEGAFADQNNIIVVGVNIMLRTSNGGLNWLQIGGVPSIIYRGLDFPSVNTGYIVGANIVLKTTDSGFSWVQQPSGTGDFFCVDFYNDSVGAAGGSTRLSMTTNGGINWVVQSIVFDSFDQVLGIKCVDSNTIIGAINSIISSQHGQVAKTTNLGLNWTKYSLQLPLVESSGDIVRDIDMINNTGFVATSFGKILKSVNGGINWSHDSTSIKLSFAFGNVIWGNYMLDENNVFFCGAGGTVFKTSNSGINWVVQTGYLRNLNDITFPGQNTGFAVGLQGVVFKTTNAGNNWSINSAGVTDRHLRSVFFTDENTGFASGDTGIILKTTNGANSWVQQFSGTMANLLSVFFLDANTGFSAGFQNNNGNGVGALLKTTNGGLNWLSLFSGNGMPFNTVFFVNSNTGFICTEYDVFKTTNGGFNWSVNSQLSGRDIYFVDENTGYTSENAGDMYKTTNCGATWFSINSGVPSNAVFHSIRFFGEFGLTAGSRGAFDGLIMQTTNGGVNWTEVLVPTNNIFSSICFTDERTWYISGNSGTILKTTNGGLTFLQSNNEIIPEKFQLHQNYPNPFNPSTKIKFEIPQMANSSPQLVSLKVFDLAGKEVALLVNTELQAGVYEADFDGSLLSSGVYFYRLEVSGSNLNESYTNTKKMILIK